MSRKGPFYFFSDESFYLSVRFSPSRRRRRRQQFRKRSKPAQRNRELQAFLIIIPATGTSNNNNNKLLTVAHHSIPHFTASSNIEQLLYCILLSIISNTHTHTHTHTHTMSTNEDKTFQFLVALEHLQQVQLYIDRSGVGDDCTNLRIVLSNRLRAHHLAKVRTNKTLAARHRASNNFCVSLKNNFCVSLKEKFKHLQLALKSATPEVAAKAAAVAVVAVALGERERIVIPPIGVSMLMALPASLRIKILNYFDEKKQEELRTLPVISKQFYEDCQHPSIEWEFIPLIEISPTKGGSTRNLLHDLMKHQTDYNNTNMTTQTTPYRSMKVRYMHQFDDSDFCGPLVQMDRITSLNFSWTPSGKTFPRHLPYYLSRMLPNLSEIFVPNTVQSFTTTYFDNGKFISKFTENCHRLEKITWNNMNDNIEYFGGDQLIHPANFNRLERTRRNNINTNKNYFRRFILVNGINMKDATNLRVLIMDNCTFFVGRYSYDISDLNNHPDRFLFAHCCKSLERVSIQKARDERGNSIRQEALVKFVRSVPTLRWFRSDLHQENIDLLTKERPDVEFCELTERRTYIITPTPERERERE